METELNDILNSCIDDGKIVDDKCKATRALNLFTRCANCNCCDRHQTNKPLVWQPINFYPINYEGTNDYSCTCICRHAARFLCYAHPNKID